MKTVRAIVTTLIWTLAGCYLLPAILLHIPAIQEMVGEKVAEVVAETLKTNVRVGRVDVGFFNRLVVDGLRIDDQQRQPMIQASRVAAKVDLVSLFQGKVRISSAQLFGLDARLYQKDAHTPPNFQFALDARTRTTRNPLISTSPSSRSLSAMVRSAMTNYGNRVRRVSRPPISIFRSSAAISSSIRSRPTD
mgnify:CR=1 FL=1